jgi:hypothetical protein
LVSHVSGGGIGIGGIVISWYPLLARLICVYLLLAAYLNYSSNLWLSSSSC